MHRVIESCSLLGGVIAVLAPFASGCAPDPRAQEVATRLRSLDSIVVLFAGGEERKECTLYQNGWSRHRMELVAPRPMERPGLRRSRRYTVLVPCNRDRVAGFFQVLPCLLKHPPEAGYDQPDPVWGRYELHYAIRSVRGKIEFAGPVPQQDYVWRGLLDEMWALSGQKLALSCAYVGLAEELRRRQDLQGACLAYDAAFRLRGSWMGELLTRGEALILDDTDYLGGPEVQAAVLKGDFAGALEIYRQKWPHLTGGFVGVERRGDAFVIAFSNNAEWLRWQKEWRQIPANFASALIGSSGNMMPNLEKVGPEGD